MDAITAPLSTGIGKGDVSMPSTSGLQELVIDSVGCAPRLEGAAHAAKLKVLLVEDDDADAYLIERALSDIPGPKEVVRAHDGVAALAIIDRRIFKPDLAIVDLHMPRKDGFSLLIELRARVTVDFPAIVLTSSRSTADAFRSRKRGAVKVLTKPNSLEKLTTVLAMALADIRDEAE